MMETTMIVLSVVSLIVSAITLLVVLLRPRDNGLAQAKDEIIKANDRAMAAQTQQNTMMDSHLQQKQDALSRSVTDAMRQMESSTSLAATIIKSANSSMIMTTCGSLVPSSDIIMEL